MKISARNSIAGKIKELESKGLIAFIRIEIKEPSIITAVITKEAAEKMSLNQNDLLKVVIKPTEIMIKNIEK